MSAISIFFRYIDSNMRHYDGWCGIYWIPGMQSGLDYIEQGHESIGPLRDKSVTILHSSPPPFFKGSNGETLDQLTRGNIYGAHTSTISWGSGSTSNLMDQAVTRIRQSYHVQEYQDSDYRGTRRKVEEFLGTDVVITPGGSKILVGQLRNAHYEKVGENWLFVGSQNATCSVVGDSVIWHLDLNTTSKPDFWDFDRTPFAYSWNVFGEVHYSDPRVYMLRAKTFLEINDPVPIDKQWELFSKIMDQLVSSTNTFASIKDVVDALITIRKYGPVGLVKPAKSLSKRIASLWLAFRYAVCTTKSDVQTYTSAIKTLTSCKVDEDLVFHASDGTYNMTVRMQRHLPVELNGVVQRFREFGLDLSFENFWDMIPFSFVVDWFAHLGDLLHDTGSFSFYDSELYTFQSICFSRGYYGLSPDGPIHYYERKVSSIPPQMVWSTDDESNKTVIKRVIDGITLIISGRKR